MLVALTLPRLLARIPDRRVMLTGAALLPIGLTATVALLVADAGRGAGWALLAGTWLVMGMGTSLINTPSARLLRFESEPENRGAVFTAQFSLSHACFFFTYTIAGWVGATVSQPIAAITLAVLATLAGLVAARAWPARTEPITEPVPAGRA